MIIEKNRFLIKTTIQIGHFFGVAPEDVIIEMREPDSLQYLGLREKWALADGNKDKQLYAIVDILDGLIVSHNLYHDEKTQFTNGEVKRAVLDRFDLFNMVITEYAEKVLFTTTTAKEETQGKGETAGETKTD